MDGPTVELPSIQERLSALHQARHLVSVIEDLGVDSDTVRVQARTLLGGEVFPSWNCWLWALKSSLLLSGDQEEFTRVELHEAPLWELQVDLGAIASGQPLEVGSVLRRVRRLCDELEQAMVGALRSQSVQQGRSPSTPAPEILPHADDLLILRELSRASAPVTVVDLAATDAVNRSERHISPRVTELIELGLVQRMPGRRGVIITDAGRDRLRSLCG